MSLRFGQPPNGSQPASDEEPSFTTGKDGVATPTADDETAPPTRPTFTARPSEPVAGTVPGPAPAPDDTLPDDTVAEDTVADDTVANDYAVNEDYAADESVSAATAEPALVPDAGTPAAPDAYPPTAAGTGAYPATSAYQPPPPAAAGPRPAPTAGPDESLLGDAAELRGRWQRVQAGFVDDPQEAVGDAADLIEQTAQALVVALRQRQRELRVEWDRRGNPGEPAAATADGMPDTEQLRLIMQRYRALFNQLCRP